jgi:tRNA threonylcarbamoyladenosine biosynthesis protein TsaE
MYKEVKNEIEMKLFGGMLGSLLSGGEFIELIGDVGAGKTTLTKGLAVGLGVKDNVQSPSFTINRVYDGRDDLILSHYDFYRLNDAGIMATELRESVDDQDRITVIEWAGVVDGALPVDKLTIEIASLSEISRKLTLSAGGPISNGLIEKIMR